jgi:hypothetical protein
MPRTFILTLSCPPAGRHRQRCDRVPLRAPVTLWNTSTSTIRSVVHCSFELKW